VSDTLIPTDSTAADAIVAASLPEPDSVSDVQSIQAIEDALVALLNARPALALFQVEAWPEDAGNYKLRSKNGALLVSYKGSKFGKTIATDGDAQLWTLDFEIVTLCRNLRSHKGAYTVLDEIRRAVSGWWAPGAINNAFLTHEGFVDEVDGVWQYATYLSIPSMSVMEDPAGPATAGNLTATTSFLEGFN
jgi:hypothetical protein